MIVAAGHALIGDERIYDRFLGCLHDGSEDWIEAIVRNCFNRVRNLVGVGRVRIRR